VFYRNPSKRISPASGETDRREEIVQLETRKTDGWVVVRPGTRRLDVESAAEFKDRLAALVESGHQRVVVDLQDVEYLDSAGLGALVSVLKAVESRDQLILASVSDRVRGLLELTGLTRLLRIVRSVSDALASDP
jgi:anti-sigma B factor antagonist